MPNTVSPLTQDYLNATKLLRTANLIEIELPSPIGASNVVYLTDYGSNVRYNGQLYEAGKVKSIGSIKHTHKLSAHTTNLVLTGLDDNIVSKAMDGVSYIGNTINIYRVILGADGNIVPFSTSDDARYMMEGTIVEVSANDTISSSGRGSSTVTFKCANEFYDLERIGGRFTSDQAHRGLVVDGNGNEVPSTAAKRPEYQTDLGFFHADKSVNILASYQATETRYKLKKKSSWGGLKTSYSMKEYQVEVTKDVDLRYNLAGKYLPVVYGVQKVDGIPIFADTDVNNPNLVTVVYAICEGEIDGYLDFWLGDAPVVCFDDADSTDRVCTGRKRNGDTVTGANGVLSTHGDIFTIDDGNAVTKFTVYHGKSNQVADPVLVSKAAANGFFLQVQDGVGSEYWDSNFKLLDTAYVIVEYELNSDRTEIPQLSVELRGKGVTTYTDINTPFNGPSTLNPAWQQLDYLTNTRYGMSIPLTKIDLQSYIDAAALYDIQDLSYEQAWCPFWAYLGWTSASSAYNRSIMQMNVTLKTEDSLFKNMESLLEQSISSLNVVGGLYTLTVEAAAAPVLDISIDDLVDGNIKASDVTIKNKYNSVSTNIEDPAKGWKDSNVVFYNANYKEEDKGVEKSLNLTFPYISNYYTCRSLSERELKKSRFNREVVITLPYYVVHAPINAPVTLTYTRYGWNTKQFLIRQAVWRQDNKVELTIREYDDDVFINADQVDKSQDQLPTTSDLVRAPRNLSYDAPPINSTTLNINGVISWDQSTTALVEYYTVRVSGSNEVYRVDTPNNLNDRLSVDIAGLLAGNYTISVRAHAPSLSRVSSPADINVVVDPIKNLPKVDNFILTNGDANGVWSSDAPEFQWLSSATFATYTLEILDNAENIVDSVQINSGNTYTWDFSRNISIYAASNGGALGYYRDIDARIVGNSAEGNSSIDWRYVNDNN